MALAEVDTTTPSAPENVTADSVAPEIVTAEKLQSIYCLVCRGHTDNKNLRLETFIRSGKERKIEKAICVKCDKKKTGLSIGNDGMETKRW